MKPSKVILVTNIPNQYRLPLFNELNNQLSSKGKELLVIFGAKDYGARKSVVDLSECNFRYQILKPSIFEHFENSRGLFFYKGLMRLLIKEKPDKVVVGGFSIPSIKVVFLNFFYKFDVIIWSGAFQTESAIKLLIRKVLIAKATQMIAYSSKAKQYFIKLGADQNKVVNAGNTVDVAFFNSINRSVDNENRKNNIYHLTYVGYLSPRKNVSLLLYALKELLLRRTDFVLDIIGDGESKANLVELAEKLNITKYVHFHGFKQKSELPIHLSESAIFLFQTNFDIWGLVLNEAMAAGIPCLASIHAGATVDLIQEGETGFKIDFSDPQNVAKKVDWMLNHPKEIQKVGENASEFIRLNYSLANCAEKMILAL